VTGTTTCDGVKGPTNGHRCSQRAAEASVEHRRSRRSVRRAYLRVNPLVTPIRLRTEADVTPANGQAQGSARFTCINFVMAVPGHFSAFALTMAAHIPPCCATFTRPRHRVRRILRRNHPASTRAAPRYVTPPCRSGFLGACAAPNHGRRGIGQGRASLHGSTSNARIAALNPSSDQSGSRSGLHPRKPPPFQRR